MSGFSDSDPESLFAKVHPVLKEADILFGNLEAAPSGKGTVVTRNSAVRSPKDSMKAIISAGFNVMSVANNHFTDHGVEAMHECLETLRNANILYTSKFRT